MEYKGVEKAQESLRGWRITRVSVSVSIRLYEIFYRVNFAVFDTTIRTAYL